MNPTGDSKLLTRKRVDFGLLAEVLARGVGYHSFRPALDDQEVFEVYRWVMASVTGRGFDRWSWPTQWGRQALASDFGGSPGCISYGGVAPILETIDRRHQDHRRGGWRETMADRFARILFDRGQATEWRKAMGIDFAKPRSIAMLVYDHVPPPPRSSYRGWDGQPRWEVYVPRGQRSGFGSEVDRLFALASTTRRLKVNFRGQDDEAEDDTGRPVRPVYYLTEVMLSPTPAGWTASVEYGFDGSRWSEDYRWLHDRKRREPRGERDPLRCFQRKDEPFANFVYRAHDKFDRLLTPVCTAYDPQSIGRDPADRWRCPGLVADGFYRVARTSMARGQIHKNPCSWGGARCEVGP